MDINKARHALESGAFMPVLSRLYGSDPDVLCFQVQRYSNALDSFEQLYPHRRDIEIFSAPGRTEIGGNHTDHQNGCVLAAAVDLDIIGVVSTHDDGLLRIKSEGYDAFEVPLNRLEPDSTSAGSSAIVRGIAARFAQAGAKLSGFDLYASSRVMSGSGISSSAAFETLIGTIIDHSFNGGAAGAVEIARIGQYAENVYFGKNCGLMDQTVCSVGGLVFIDFADVSKPAISSFEFDFEQHGYCLCITDTCGSHADLTDDYAAIRSEMESVAACFGQRQLRRVSRGDFYSRVHELRRRCSDRALLRAMHFLDENTRAAEEAAALADGSIEQFLSLVRASARSSEQLLQNLYSTRSPLNQAIPLAIALRHELLGGRGAVRVHGGGFAGTVQAFVPVEMIEHYTRGMEQVFGEGSCIRLRIRPAGGIKITTEV